MTNLITYFLRNKHDLLLLSNSYKRGEIKLNITKIANHLNVDRKTVRKYLNGYKPKINKTRKKYLDMYLNEINKVLNDKHQTFEYKQHLYNYFKREYNIKCSRSTFTEYITKNQELNQKFNQRKYKKFTERFETNPGEQIQFDMKENIKLITESGETQIVNIATLTLGYSRYNIRKLIIEKDTDTLISFLAESLEKINGSPKELVIDNLKQFVTKPKDKENEAIFNSKFEQFCKDYNIKIYSCMPYRPQTKGKTETQNKIVDQLKNYNGKYKDIDEMHEKLFIINEEDNTNISQATLLPRKFLYEKEKGKFQSLPNNEIRKKYYLTLNEVIVSNESLITYKTRKYSVPKKYIGHKVGLAIISNKLHIYYSNKIITIHKITNNLLNIKKEHSLYYEKQAKELITIKNNIIQKELENIKYD